MIGSPAFTRQYNVRGRRPHRPGRSRLGHRAISACSQAREGILFPPLVAAFILRYPQGTETL